MDYILHAILYANKVIVAIKNRVLSLKSVLYLIDFAALVDSPIVVASDLTFDLFGLSEHIKN